MVSGLRLSGSKEFKANLAILKDIGFSRDEIYNRLGDAVEPMAAQIRENFRPYSESVAASVKVWRKEPNHHPKKKTVAIIVNRQMTMRTWIAGKIVTSPRAKRAPGEKVAESLAAMIEMGTSKTWSHGAGMQAHWCFKSGVDQAKGGVVKSVMDVVRIMVEIAAKEFDKPPSQ